jgi:hypothetical protein
LIGIETVAFPPETIAGDRSPSVFAVAFGVTPISGVGADGPAELIGAVVPAEPAEPIVAFPPLMMAGESLPRVEACWPPDQPLATHAMIPNAPTPKAPIASKRSVDARYLAGTNSNSLGRLARPIGMPVSKIQHVRTMVDPGATRHRAGSRGPCGRARTTGIGPGAAAARHVEGYGTTPASSGSP